MNFVTGVIVFLLIWWTALFAVLPFGHRRDTDGTPVKANIKKKFFWTTIVSVIIWGIVFALIEYDVISFRDIAHDMVEKDYSS